MQGKIVYSNNSNFTTKTADTDFSPQIDTWVAPDSEIGLPPTTSGHRQKVVVRGG